MSIINLQSELAAIRALQWDKQPAAYERLCSEYACRCAHLERRAESYKKQLEILTKPR